MGWPQGPSQGKLLVTVLPAVCGSQKCQEAWGWCQAVQGLAASRREENRRWRLLERV